MNQETVALNHFSLSSKNYYNVKSNVLISMHKHYEIEIMLVNSGKILFNVNGIKSTLSSGDIMIVSSNVPHSTISVTDASYYLLFISPNILKKQNDNLYHDTFNNEPYRLLRKNDKYCDEMAKCILENYKCTEEYSLKGFTYLIVGLLSKMKFFDEKSNKPSLSNKNIEMIKKAKQYINKHIYENMKLKDIAKELYIDSSYLCRIFKKGTGFTVKEYINYKKCNIAKDLLLTTSNSVTEVSYKLNFASTSLFIKVFKKYNIVTPIQYRNMNRTEIAESTFR